MFIIVIYVIPLKHGSDLGNVESGIRHNINKAI